MSNLCRLRGPGHPEVLKPWNINVLQFWIPQVKTFWPNWHFLDTSRQPAALPLTSTKEPTCRLRGDLGAASVKCGGGGDFVCSQLGETCRDEEWHHHLWHVWNSGKSMTGPQRRRHGAAPPPRRGATVAELLPRRSARWPSSMEHGVHDETIEQRCHQQPFVTLCTLLHFVPIIVWFFCF